MTISNDIITLWDNGNDKLCLFSVPVESQYRYIDGLPCITAGISYENAAFKGHDTFTFLDRFYTELLDDIRKIYSSLTGAFRLYDMAATTDGYIDFEMNRGKLIISGKLGASFSSHSLDFSFEADQTLLKALIQSISI